MTNKINLIPKKSLIKTGDVDHADWNYRPLLGTISFARFRLITKLLKGKYGDSLLEIGYGSGVFLPELSKYAENLYGIDIHDKYDEVKKKLSEIDVDAELHKGGAEKLIWKDNSIDFAVAVSSLEFVDDLDQVCKEVKRVLKKNGRFFIVTPSKSALVDFGLKIMTGVNAKEDFGDSRDFIIPTLKKHFEVKQELNYPKLGASLVKLYTALELTPKK